MQFDLQGADPRFAALKGLLTADGHTIGPNGPVVAPPAQRRGLPYYEREDYAVRNAALTAEGAVMILMQRCAPLLGSRVLLVGYGRIAQQLARRLAAFGACVTVATRRAAARALAETAGFAAQDTADIRGTYDIVINTVPAPVLRGAYGAALCLELASASGGWADETPVLHAGGLPAKYAPEAAARIVRDAIYETIREDERWKS